MLGDKLSPGTKPGFLKSEKMLGLQLLYIHKSVLENVYVYVSFLLLLVKSILLRRRVWICSGI